MLATLSTIILLNLGTLPVNCNQEQPGTEAISSTYRILRPEKIESGMKYPLIVFLHGAGERGDDNKSQMIYFPELMQSDTMRRAHPCFVLAVQCPRDDSWVDYVLDDPHWSGFEDEPTAALESASRALLHVTRSEPIDTDRIYLTGLSMGGYGTWDLSMRHPDWFAALVPICGGGSPDHAGRIVGMPTWVVHCRDDSVVPVDLSRTMVKALGSLGGAPTYTEYKGVGHDSWTPGYRDLGTIPWMFRQHKQSSPAGMSSLGSSNSPLAAGTTIVFLGDSITQAGNEPGGYVDLIRGHVTTSRPDDRINMIGAGVSGNKVPDLLARLDRDVLVHEPDIVVVYIGINDVWHSQSGHGTPIDVYESGLQELVDRVSATGASIVLVTPTTIGEKRDGTNPLDDMLNQYADVGRRIADRNGLQVCDLRTIMADSLLVHNPRDLPHGIFTTDGVHMNARGNRFLADHVSRSIATHCAGAADD